MTEHRRRIRIVLVLIACGVVLPGCREAQPREGGAPNVPAAGDSPVVVQGVLDWAKVGAGRCRASSQVVTTEEWRRNIFKECWDWDEPNGSITHYTVKDEDIFLPQARQIDAPISFGVMAGAVLTASQPGHAKPEIDRCEIWVWEDVNFNRKADPDDRIDGVEQTWRRLCVSTPGEVNRIIDVIPDGSDFAHKRRGLFSGESYLLLIRVQAGKVTNFNFTGPVTVNDTTVTADPARRVADEWAPSGHGAYGGHDGSGWSGVDDYEILWFRINNPPGPPVVGRPLRE